jgi:hypothetical protein
MGSRAAGKIAPLAALLDQSHGGDAHSKALDAQLAKVSDPSLTPSAQVLAAMAEHKESFAQFSLRQSQAHAEFFRSEPLPAEEQARLKNWRVRRWRNRRSWNRTKWAISTCLSGRIRRASWRSATKRPKIAACGSPFRVYSLCMLSCRSCSIASLDFPLIS